MKRHFPHPWASGNSRGVALFTVLAVLTLTTTIVVTFLVATRFELASSNAYSKSLITDEIARGAVEELVAQLGNEALEAAKQSRNSNTFGLLPTRVGISVTNARTQPVLRRSAHMDDGTFASLFSANGVANPPPNLASPLSSTNASPDGRLISTNRWRAPMLLDAGATPPVPDWIFVTRAGTRKVADGDVSQLRDVRNPNNLDAVIGRFAYVIYDTSGLLDAELAGSPVRDVRNGEKGSSALASLDPVFVAAGGIPSQAAMFTGWRNPDATASSFFSAIYGKDPTPGNPGTPGLLESGLQDMAAGVNPLFTRQDMIKFAGDNPDAFPKDALSRLSSFSRASNAPEIDAAIPGRTGYLEASSNLEIPRYDAKGKPAAYTVKKGEPLLQRKFPLSRLRWFEHCNANGKLDDSYAAAVKQHFGLTWMDNLAGVSGVAAEYGGVGGFVYTSPTGTGPASAIKTLAQVAAENREPDFFEWLKTAINPDSLGISGGPVNTSVADIQDSSRDFHLIQMGANIIDQADSNDIPMLIASATTQNRNNGPALAFGIENLPYINEIITAFYRPPANSTELHAYLQFEMWNPHQDAGRIPLDYAGGAIGGGDRFRIRVVEGRPWVNARLRMQDNAGNVMPAIANYGFNRREIVPKTFTGDLNTDTVTFSGDEMDFGEPRLLGDDPESSAGALSYNSGRIIRVGPPPGEAGFVGIDAGYSEAPNPALPAGVRFKMSELGPNVDANLEDPSAPSETYQTGEKYYNSVSLTCVNDNVVNPPAEQPMPVTFVAELQMTNGQWVPYQTIEGWNYGGAPRDKPGSNSNEPRTFGGGGNTPSLNWEPNNYKDSTSPSYKAWSWTNPGNNPTLKPFSGILTGPLTSRDFYGWNNIWIRNSVQKIDPRTRRFGLPLSATRKETGPSPGASIREDVASPDRKQPGYDYPGWGMSNWGTSSPVLERLAVNLPSSSFGYKDRDGIRRPGDWAYLNSANYPDVSGQTEARPVILNRPFRSIAELGYVFRDLPWKTIDFFSPFNGSNPQSGDLALLDVFCIEDSPVTRGRINPNTARPEILEALLTGTAKNSASFALQSSGSVGSPQGLANALATEISAGNSSSAVRKTSELVARLMKSSLFASEPNEILREAYARGLIGSVDTRTWNLLIDIVAQSGRFPVTATKLDQFQSTGERRYWAHVAIDRITGKVIDLAMEPVYE